MRVHSPCPTMSQFRLLTDYFRQEKKASSAIFRALWTLSEAAMDFSERAKLFSSRKNLVGNFHPKNGRFYAHWRWISKEFRGGLVCDWLLMRA